MSSILYVLLYILGGIITLTYNYYETSGEPEPADLFLFILWPFAAVMVIAAGIFVGPVFLSHYIAKKLKK